MRGITTYLAFILIALVLPYTAHAQESAVTVEGEVTDEPLCFNVINKAPYGITGSITSNYYTNEDGVRARHRSNFRLKVGEQTEFCTYGPFYEGRKLEFTLRTLVPIFSCQTALYEDIIVYGRRKSEGGTETWAECL